MSRKVLGMAALSAVALAGLAGALAGCDGSPTGPSPFDPRFVRVVGTLTDEGVECPAMRGDDGTLYTLGPRELVRGEVGDRVRVVGRIAEGSICMQGTSLVIESFEVL